MCELRTAQLSFRLAGTPGGDGRRGPLLVFRSGLVGAAANAGLRSDPVFAGLQADMPADWHGPPPLLVCPRDPVLSADLARLVGRVDAVYLPPPLHLGLHWLQREMATRGSLPQAHLLGLSSRLAGWLRALPRMQRTAGSRPDDDALGQLGLRLQAELQTHFAEKLTLDALAGRLGTGRAQLTRALRRLNGFSVARYRTELRLRHAAAALLDGAPHCTAVARQVGYASPGRFSGDFARLYGAPPSRLAALLEAAIGLGDGQGHVRV